MQPVASTINTLAGALYKVFRASPDQARKEMRQACFDYLSLGGIFSNGPISLLSGLNPKPLSLVLHFFAVAIYGVGRLLLPFPSPARLWIGARLISVCLASLSYLIPEQKNNTLSLYVSLWLDWVNFLDVIFLLQGASGIIFPIIKAEGVRKMFFPAIVPAYYRAPPVKSWPLNWLTHWKSRDRLPNSYTQLLSLYCGLLFLVWNIREIWIEGAIFLTCIILIMMFKLYISQFVLV